MSQSRLSSLPLLNIKNKRAQSLSLDYLIPGTKQPSYANGPVKVHDNKQRSNRLVSYENSYKLVGFQLFVQMSVAR